MAAWIRRSTLAPEADWKLTSAMRPFRSPKARITALERRHCRRIGLPLPADAESFVPALVEAGPLEHDAENDLVRPTFEGLRRITPAQLPRSGRIDGLG